MNRNWRKSSYSDTLSGTGTQECVEIGAWRKSTYSGPGSAQGCVGAGTGPGVVGIRDTTLREASPVLAVSPGAWRAFTSRLK